MNWLKVLRSWGGTALSWLGGVNLTPWLLVLALAGTLGGAWWGWSHGADSTRNEMQAEYNANVAAAYREAANKQQAAITRANALAMDLYNTRRDLDAERANITRRMPHAVATVPAACSFGPEFVGLLNDAFALSAADHHQDAGSGGNQGNATAAGPADAGVRRDASVMDLAAWLRDVGRWCRETQAVSAARLKLLEDAP